MRTKKTKKQYEGGSEPLMIRTQNLSVFIGSNNICNTGSFCENETITFNMRQRGICCRCIITWGLVYGVWTLGAPTGRNINRCLWCLKCVSRTVLTNKWISQQITSLININTTLDELSLRAKRDKELWFNGKRC